MKEKYLMDVLDVSWRRFKSLSPLSFLLYYVRLVDLEGNKGNSDSSSSSSSSSTISNEDDGVQSQQQQHSAAGSKDDRNSWTTATVQSTFSVETSVAAAVSADSYSMISTTSETDAESSNVRSSSSQTEQQQLPIDSFLTPASSSICSQQDYEILKASLFFCVRTTAAAATNKGKFDSSLSHSISSEVL